MVLLQVFPRFAYVAPFYLWILIGSGFVAGEMWLLLSRFYDRRSSTDQTLRY